MIKWVAGALGVALLAGVTHEVPFRHELVKPLGPLASATSAALTTPPPTPTATVAVAAASNGYVVSPTVAGAPELVANFPVTQGLTPAWGTGAIPGLYGNGDEGAFRFVCGAEGPLRYDDPLVKPGQPGVSHLHFFWGPTDIDANTTMDTLGATVGKSTCNGGANTLNRSAYWAPALLDDNGYVRNADYVSVYYKQPTPRSPRCTPGSPTFQGTCVALPNRLRMVFGWDAAKPDEPMYLRGSTWYCSTSNQGYGNLNDLFHAGCKVGAQLIASVSAPECWDGKYLDTPNHRDHMAFAGYGSWGYLKCPATHPYLIPRTESKIGWTVTADMFDPVTLNSRLHLSSDHMKIGSKPGETLHSDYMEQWVGAAKKMWQEGCIAKGLDCSGGDLGNGLMLWGAAQPSYGWTNPNPKSATKFADMMM